MGAGWGARPEVGGHCRAAAKCGEPSLEGLATESGGEDKGREKTAEIRRVRNKVVGETGGMAAPSLGSGKRVYLGHLPSNLTVTTLLQPPPLLSPTAANHTSSSRAASELSPLNCVLALTVFMRKTFPLSSSGEMGQGLPGNLMASVRVHKNVSWD